MSKMYFKKMLSLTLALVMVLSLAACGSKPAAPAASAAPAAPAAPAASEAPAAPAAPAEPKYKERIVVVSSGVMINEDPTTSNTSENAQIRFMTHNTLVDYDAVNSKIVPDLAESWTVSEDGKVYTFNLRKGVKFHDGSDLTADDVLFTLDRAATSSYHKGKFEDVEKMEAVDDHTFVITMKDINSGFLRTISGGFFSIFSKSAVEADPEHGFKIGTGAFVQTEWVPDDHVTVTRNEEYWGEMPKSKVIEWRKVSEGSARVIGLQTGEYDICLAVPASEVSHVQDDPNCNMIVRSGSNLHYLGINTISQSNPALHDVKVRAALNYATNHEDLVIAMTEGLGFVPNGIIPSDAYGYSDKVNAPHYDIEKAKALLTEAGYPNGITVSLTTNAAKWGGLFELLQAQWAQAGITLTLDTDDATVRSDHIKAKSYELVSNNWTFADTQTILFNLFHSTSGSNRSLIKDPYIDEALTSILRQTDEAEVLKIYEELSQYLVDTQGIIPLYIAPVLYGTGKNVQDAVLINNSNMVLTYANVPM